jgi:hypothetical protein
MHNYPWLVEGGELPEIGTGVKPKNSDNADKPKLEEGDEDEADVKNGNRSD